MKKLKIALILGGLLFFFVFVTLKIYGLISGPDTQCSFSHVSSITFPRNPTTAQDFFALGNYHYDIGKCEEAIIDYSNAIALDPTFVQAYNNRGYTNMRVRDYASSLIDLNMAIAIKPTYPQPYLNRGDLYNYYGPVIDRLKAIADYKKAISLGAVHNTSVCGHLAMAETNNLIPLAILKFVFNRGYCR